MDRSFLSQPEVIAASRQFVCIRLTTYEDAEESLFLKSLVQTRSGEVENSSFAILGPDGKERLTRSGRGMHTVYSDATSMAKGMTRLAQSYSPKADVKALPLVRETHLAIDVASSDSQPLVVIFAKDAQKRAEIEAAVAQLAWQPQWIGRFVFHSTSDARGLGLIEGLDAKSSFAVVQPDKFGTRGKVIAQTSESNTEALEKALASGSKAFQKESKSFMNHVREGQRLGVYWEPKNPVTDPQEVKARERGRKQ